MQLTDKAKQLIKELENEEEEISEELVSMHHSLEDFYYNLFDGGYIKLEEWLEGDDLIKVKNAVEVLLNFKNKLPEV
jgi:hypothetical protein